MGQAMMSQQQPFIKFTRWIKTHSRRTRCINKAKRLGETKHMRREESLQIRKQ